MKAHIKSVRLNISGMTCDHCAKSIEKILEKQEGVVNKSIRYREGGGELTFDKSKVSEADLKSAIDATGHYRVESIEELSPPLKEEQGSNYDFDLIIIGGGSAAFSAASRAGELGKKILMINGGLPIGGTCVNVGCVPSKNLIRAAESIYHGSHTRFSGIRLSSVEINFPEIIQEKRALVDALRDKKYLSVAEQIPGLSVISGKARLLGAQRVQVDSKQWTASRILIATGSRTKIPPIKGLENSGYLTNRTLFDLEEKPESLTILGAGYIGLEIAQAYRRFGTEVRIIEFTDRPLRSQTSDISKEIRTHLEAEGIRFFPNHRVDELTREDNGILMIKGIDRSSGKAFKWEEKGKLLIATGLTPNTDNMGLEAAGVEVDERGYIKVDSGMRTSANEVYAAGDCINSPAFVYTAAKEARIAAENALTNANEEIDYTGLPWVVFTDPQVAGAGMDELEAEAAGIPYEISKVPLSEVPRALAARDTRGFIKLIRDKSNDHLIGARIVAAEGGELAMQASLAIKYNIPVQELADSFFPYLTLSEGIKLAAITFKKDISMLSCCAS